jgi:ATP-dependent DNA helicase DinG
VPVLVQKRGDSVADLVSRFAADERSILLGTLSLWQGVDVPGEACHLVVIDRIPFPRPDDPLIAARSKWAEEHGGNGFTAVSVPRAALLLAQGVGRLIRTSSDRGVVAVLDPRLATARYGDFLRRSLPPFWFTTDGALVRQSLTRLDDLASQKP